MSIYSSFGLVKPTLEGLKIHWMGTKWTKKVSKSKIYCVFWF